MRLIDADQMAVDESEAYMSAQVQITDDLKWLVNFAAHSKIQRFIADTPTVDAVPVVHGRWQPVRESEMTGWQPELAGYDPIGGYICSVCKEETVYDCNYNFVLSNYCPHCGAKMDGGDD